MGVTLAEHVDTEFAVADRSKPSDDVVEPRFPKIVAAGRMKAIQMPPIANKIIELSGMDKPKVLYIATASFDSPDKFRAHTKAFRKRGCDIECLSVSEKPAVPSNLEMRRLVVDWADVILCSGGNTLHALLRWKETGLDVLMKEAAEKGAVLCGGSAGAGCWFSSVHTDSLAPETIKSDTDQNESGSDSAEEVSDWDYVKIAGMGYIDAMCVPQFNSTGTNNVARAEDAEHFVLKDPEKPAIGIDENAAFVVEGDKAMVVSGDGKATCHVVVADEKGETAATPIVPTEEPVPIKEIMEIAAPSEASHLEALEEHVDEDFAVGADDLQPAQDAVDTQIPKIVAAGRMKAMQMPAIFEKVIELSGVEKPKIVYVGTASFDRTDKYNLCTKAFRELECEIERLDVSEESTVPPDSEMRRLVVDWADVILCSGGNTLHSLLRWRETGLDALMKEAAEKGKVLCGGSAGAGCWFSSLHSDSLRPDNVKNAERVKTDLSDEDLKDWDYAKISGMGYIDAMCVPHFDATGTNDVSRAEHAEQFVAGDPDKPAIGIDENAAFVVEGDKAMVVSGDGEATCHVVVADEKGETTATPIEPSKEPVRLEDMLDVAASNE